MNDLIYNESWWPEMRRVISVQPMSASAGNIFYIKSDESDIDYFEDERDLFEL